MEDVWKTTGQELIRIFRMALIQLIPAMDESRIKWKGNNSYDDWEEIKQVLFRNIVTNSILNSNSYTHDAMPEFGTYPQKEHSLFISFESIEIELSDGKIPILIDLESNHFPFDTVRYTIYSTSENSLANSVGSVSYDSCKFNIVYISTKGTMHYQTINVDL